MRRFGSLLFVLLSFILLGTGLAIPQESEHDSERFGRHDDPRGREVWFRRGRQTRNGQPPARMLHQAYQAKMKMRAAREARFHSLAATRARVDTALAASVGTWSNLGPRPILDNPATPNGYGPVAGRVTAVVVDQKDPTGNTVYTAGA